MTDKNEDQTPSLDDYESDLISIVAHDLKAPVGAIRGFIELTQYSGPLNERQEHFINRAMMALTRMENLIASLLDFARLESGIVLEITDVDLHVLINDTFDLLTDVAAQRRIKLHLQPDSEKVVVQGDERLLGHVLNNLVSNSIKYNREGGEVWIKVSPQGALVQVDVRDSGIGIPEEVQHRVFERFYRAHKSQEEKIDGSGLGLAITQMIIQMHQGEIWLKSLPGTGSTFSFTLPLLYVNDSDKKQATDISKQGYRESLFQPDSRPKND